MNPKLTTEQRDEIFKAWEDSQDHEDGGYFAEWLHDNTEEEEQDKINISP